MTDQERIKQLEEKLAQAEAEKVILKGALERISREVVTIKIAMKALSQTQSGLPVMALVEALEEIARTECDDTKGCHMVYTANDALAAWREAMK